MNHVLIIGFAFVSTSVLAGFWLGWQLLKQNGRMLLRLEALEKQLEGKAESRRHKTEIAQDGKLASGNQKAEIDDYDERAGRFSQRSLAGSKLKRDGLKAGTPAPEFRLPRLEGGELVLSKLRGRFVLLVFSSPKCGPCNTLAPKLEKLHRKFPELELVMISQHEPQENRAKVKEHGLTFPVLLQKQWEASRDYAYFATPVAYPD
jgi:thiol-disulfide isomerase/thioredoxin